MRSREFEHVLAAAAEITGEEEFVVIGSQAILGSIAAPPSALLVSMEVDIYPMHAQRPPSRLTAPWATVRRSTVASAITLTVWVQ